MSGRLTPQQEQEIKDLRDRVNALEHRDAISSGSELLQKAAKTGGALVFFFGMARSAYRAFTVWMETPK